MCVECAPRHATPRLAFDHPLESADFFHRHVCLSFLVSARDELAEVAFVLVKLGLLTSILSVVFVLCAVWAGVVFYNNLKGYQVDYI